MSTRAHWPAATPGDVRLAISPLNHPPPLAASLMPARVPPPPDRGNAGQTALAIAGVALTCIIAVGLILLTFAIEHGWFG